MGEAAAASGPDFSQGVRLADMPVDGILAGRVGDEPVILSWCDGELHAVGGACTHYGASLAGGLVQDGTIRCPLHHACFSLRTGAALKAPAFEGLPRWQVEVEGDFAVVRRRTEAAATAALLVPADAPESVVIVGGGAAGFACADGLRRLGYGGRLTMLSADADPPCDRPNLSKDYLAGTAPAEWIPLRDEAWYRDQAIELHLRATVTAIDATARTVTLATGESLPFDRLLIATGAEPIRLPLPGFERENVHVLRSLADARRLLEQAAPGSRAAIVGSSFIAMEAAAALRARNVDVGIVSLDAAPFERVLGAELGAWFQQLHEANGVGFALGRRPAAFDGSALRLDDGRLLPADFVLLGTGVRPRTALASAAGIAVSDGILVDRYLQTGARGIYAAGDVAAYPDARHGRIRIEHWVAAQRQGQAAAANMLGLNRPYVDVPFFWTEQYGVALRYAGHASRWDEVGIDGDMAAGAFTARYYEDGRHRASASVGRELELLEDERGFEQALEQGPGTLAGTRHPRLEQARGGARGLL
jgi:NADPH-dependent 2,4-dienoyl-CoA reductase/sulfur reductase-like enzyme/nitrite reductase/ring-hydroxylating ferredoxin subunit